MEEKKFEACKKLTEMREKRITKKELTQVSEELGMKYSIVKKAWDNFQESGGKTLNKRITTGRFIGKNIAGWHGKNPPCTKSRKDITSAKAGDIIREYMTQKIKIYDLCKKYQIPYIQFYSWIHELNTSGTLLGFKVLNPTKYAKIETKLVIYYHRYPNTKKKEIVNLSNSEKLAYRNVASVLLKYLPSERTKVGKETV